MLKQLQLIFLLVVLLQVVSGQKLYDILGVSPSATTSQIRKVYRKLALKYHPDKHPKEKRAEVEKEFVVIANAFKVLSSDVRRKRYDDYGTVDEEFNSFDDAFSAFHAEVEDTPLNWLFLILMCATLIVPVLFVKGKSKTKAVNRQREALLEKMKSKKN